VDRELETAGRSVVNSFVYKLNGTESANQMGPLVFKTKATWEGSTLVLSSAVSTGGNAIGDLRETYRLETGELVVETTRKTAAGTASARTVHRKA
jgi:hypothetical protein